MPDFIPAFVSREDCPLPEVPRIRSAAVEECLIVLPPEPVTFTPPTVAPPPGVTPPTVNPPTVPPPPLPPPHISCAEIEVRSEPRYEHADARALEQATREFESEEEFDRPANPKSDGDVTWIANRATEIYNDWKDVDPRKKDDDKPRHIITKERTKEFLEFRRLRHIEKMLRRVERIYAAQDREVKGIIAEITARAEQKSEELGEPVTPVYPSNEDLSEALGIEARLVAEMRKEDPFELDAEEVLKHPIFVDHIEEGGSENDNIEEEVEWLLENPLGMVVESEFDNYDGDNCFPIIHIDPVIPCPEIEIETSISPESESGEAEFEAEVENLDPCGQKIKLDLKGVGVGVSQVQIRRVGTGSLVGDIKASVQGSRLTLTVVKTNPLYC